MPNRRTVLIAAGVALVAGLVAIGTVLSASHPYRPEEVGPLSEMDGPLVDNPAPDPEHPAFVLSREPLFTVGKLRERLDDELWQVLDAVLVPNGGIAVINPAYEVRLFDDTGRSIRLIAKKGNGPGEVATATRLARVGDSLIVWDPMLGRLTTFDSASRVVRTTRVPSRRALCCFPDGAVLLASEIGPMVDPPPVRMRRRWFLMRNDSDSVPRHILTLEDGDPQVHLEMPSGAFMEPTVDLPFARSAMTAIAGSDIIYGYNDQLEYRVYSREGELQRIVRAAHSPVSIERGHIANARRDFVPPPHAFPRYPRPAVEAQRRGMAQAFDRFELPETMPAFGRILGDADGSVWIRNYLPPGDTVPEYWARFDSTGRLRGTLAIPPDTRVVRFDRGHIILREQIDADGFVALRVHRIDLVTKE